MKKKLIFIDYLKLILVIFFGWTSTISTAQSDLQQGTDYFNKRAENHEDLKVDSTNISKAIYHLTKALEIENDNEKATDYLLLSYYYKAAFVVKTKTQQKKYYLLGMRLGEQAIKKYPKNKAILLWYIANFSKYGEAQGIFISAKNGLADKIKKYTEKLLDIDPSFADGAPHRIMGVINYKVPYIPLFLTWPSKERAEEHLKKALHYNPRSIANLYYFAEFLVEEKRYSEAKVILDRIFKLKPRPNSLIEDLYDIEMSKKLKEKIN